MVLVSIGTAEVAVSLANLHFGVRPPRPEGFMTDCGWQKLCKGLGNSMPRKDLGQATRPFGRAYSHHIPLARLKCLSEKRRLELAGRLGGEPGGARKLESSRHGYFRPLFRSGA